MRHKLVCGLMLVLGICWLASGNQSAPGASRARVFPGADWERVTKPESIGYSSAKLDALRRWLGTQHTTAMFVSVGGRVVFEYGEIDRLSRIASVRKSVLGMLYGTYVANGTIDLHKTVKQVGLDDVEKFLPIEEHATLEMLLMSRSGIYRPGAEADASDEGPLRGSQFPGTFYYYNNWDFEAAGIAFEKLTGRDIYDALETDIAKPIGMQDFNRARQKQVSRMPPSVHPSYNMFLSSRDMARLGLLMLRGGEWSGKRVLPDHWVDYLTTLITPVTELFPTNLRLAETTGTTRWGYGVMWWVWDQPRLPRGVRVGDFNGAYSAMGAGGQYITVLPEYDMVVVHKVEIDGEAPGNVTELEYSTILQMLMLARCKDACK